MSRVAVLAPVVTGHRHDIQRVDHYTKQNTMLFFLPFFPLEVAELVRLSRAVRG